MKKELIEALEDLMKSLELTSDTSEWRKAMGRAGKVLQKAKEQQGGKTSELEVNQRSVSDEEIKEEGKLRFHYYGEGEFSEGRALGFKDGAKWMRNKLNK